jgi:hypothetical protein
MKNGHTYSLSVHELDGLERFAGTDVFISYLVASESGHVNLNCEQISSYHISTPKIREIDEAWEKHMNPKNWE